MKNKSLILISLLLLITIISIGSVVATDNEEINMDNINNIDNNEDIANIDNVDNVDNSNINNPTDIRIDNSNLNRETELDSNLNKSNQIREDELEQSNAKSNLKSSKLSSTITVDGSDENQMSNPTIQSAIDSANAGDTIIITGKSYVHCHFIVNKPLTIISEIGTSMSPCPSNTKGSGAHGIFYISPEASGTVLKGFNLTNTYGDYDDYGILIRGAENVEIINCTINTVSDGDGIRIENATNTKIADCLIKDSNIGINITGSSKTTVTNNNITNNKVTGVNVGINNNDTTIHTNNITYNQHSGIDLYSGDYVYILNNFIGHNQNSKSSSGAGIYVNSNITKVEIKGNFLKQNGQYGVLNDYRVRNMDASRGAETLEINNNNYYLGHTERITYHIEYSKYAGGPFTYDSENDLYVYVGDGNGDWDIGKTVVYLGYAFYRDETVCGSTLFKAPSTTWGTEVYKLEISPISQVKKGVYSVSIVDVNGIVASDISSIYVTFYLNKNNTDAEPQSGDIYKTVLMENGTATVNLTDKEFKESGNKITACFPGLYNVYTINPYATFDVNDSDIPGSYRNTTINATDMSLVPNSGNKITARLTDENGNPVAGESLQFKISGISTTYTRTTDENGEANLKVSLSNPKTYTVNINFKGSENYNKSSKTIKLTVKKQTPKIESSNIDLLPKSGENFTVTLKDANNKAIANKEISFTLGKKTYTRTTDENGQASLKINLANTGKYTITTKSEKTSQYNEVSKSNTITIKTGANKVNIESSDKTYIPKSGENFTVTLKDANSNPIASKEISFTLGKKTYTRTTNENGQASLKINLANTKKYPITTKYAGDDTYSSASAENTITIAKAAAELTTYNRTYINKSGQMFSAKLTDKNNIPLENEKISFTIGKKTYNRTTDADGLAYLTINLAYDKNISTKFLGNDQYNAKTNTNSITITDEIETAYIDKGLKNDEIQRIIDEIKPNYDVKFLGDSYDDVNLNINKTLLIYTDVNTTLNGKSASPVFNLRGGNIGVSFFNINVNSTDGEGYGIILNNTKEAVIDGNTISNILDSSKMTDYNNGSTILPGHGIEILNSKATLIEQNNIDHFESGIYMEYSDDAVIRENTITENNYGIKYGFGNSNTQIYNNTIIDNIGWYTEEVPEGPRGYGAFLNNSATNITITDNNISNNYMGISVDANKSTGIVITRNLIADNSLEGIRFNEGYDLAENAIEPVVTDNAIYRNAEGPSLMILGEMSANPNGIYGAGQWDDSMKLKIDPNWYGVNNLRTWDYETGIVGVGTMCPRIKSTTIKFNTLEYENGTYKINFYKNGTFAINLAKFDIYATINRNTDKKAEVHFYVENGTGTFSFDKSNYLDSNNTIEISVGSLINVVDRIYSVVYAYDVPDSEIPN
ncbi:adhesin-like protein [Methanobrevibacter ruminantium M1]|uniref:Adhesin-like protein n=1 Tax=Methanobrevibacter ruminantium (strain ATCC 35063 / DSM 1093 / JCM 13430 / OCM 146 / M1) TaxID=634498 RepID=D3DZT1_METRM|nr:right-handed parallel beta-helix repeat-containing protein [Methanobrevibacter ruminantium]ADC46107.1 adhesin-like protein [Methanobrevibacter ruminantium M1]